MMSLLLQRGPPITSPSCAIFPAQAQASPGLCLHPHTEKSARFPRLLPPPVTAAPSSTFLFAACGILSSIHNNLPRRPNRISLTATAIAPSKVPSPADRLRLWTTSPRNTHTARTSPAHYPTFGVLRRLDVKQNKTYFDRIPFSRTQFASLSHLFHSQCSRLANPQTAGPVASSINGRAVLGL